MPSLRANWKGFIRFGEVTAPVALYTAASSSERIAFNILNRKTGNKVRREFIDSETEKPVDKDDQVKGYEIENGQFIVLDPEEVAAAVPESNKTMTVLSFIPANEIDDVYFDKPYYLAPDRLGGDVFAALREGMRRAQVAAIARTVLFRRMRTLLIRPDGDGLIATTLNFDYEVRDAQEAFSEMPDLKIEGEMLDLAKHIIKTKVGEFHIEEFEDRYEIALKELVTAKIEGRPVPKVKVPAISTPNDLLKALRESADLLAGPPRRATGKNSNKTRQPQAVQQKRSTSRRKAG
jgi:DNA end-binding protein Ku